jgi:outer membrane receptor protein involved in Fe transport
LGYRIKTFVYRTHFKNDLEGNAFSTGYKFGQEFQLNTQPTVSTSLTSGFEWIADRVHSPNNLFGDHTGYSLAAYTQAELEPSESLTLSVGARYDRGKVGSRDPADRFSPKIGLSYQVASTTSLRSTLGWGFRNPSIAEIYTNTEFSGVPIVPNPLLKPERSISFESGLLHQFSWMQLDIAGFYSRYHDLIEARPEVTGAVSFRNVSKGRIAGLELSTQIALGFLTLDGNYTLLDAVESLPTGNLYLPYRSRHIVGGGLVAKHKNLILGSRYTYRSAIKKGVTGLFPEGTRDLIPIHLLDLSFSYDFSPLTITFTIHNTLEYNYARTERNLGPPRRFTLSIAGDF